MVSTVYITMNNKLVMQVDYSINYLNYQNNASIKTVLYGKV